jgi:thiol-disulfide isomerase/thioredoxin
MRPQSSLFILLSTLFLISCSGNEKSDVQNQVPVGTKPVPENLIINAIPSLDASAFRNLLDQHKGKTVFINTWATWCIPCKEEFPDLVKLADNYRDTDVVIIGISVDYPDEVESKIKPFLQQQKANFPNFVQNFNKPEELIDLLNPEWRGAVPATFIYDKNGNQRAFLLGKHTFDQFKQKIESVRRAG